MKWRFPPHVHAAAVNGDLVLLDLGTDEYACLPGAGVRRAGPMTDPAGLDQDVVDILAQAGLLERDGNGAPGRDEPPCPAVRDLRDHPAPRVTPADLLDALGALRDLRRTGPDATVRTLLDLSSGPGREARRPAAVLRAAAVFARLLPWLPVRNQCLHRSALLMTFLARKGLAAEWIFGVRTWPFRAHCWVQSGDVCLNDDVERLQAYAVILVSGAGSVAHQQRREVRLVGEHATMASSPCRRPSGACYSD